MVARADAPNRDPYWEHLVRAFDNRLRSYVATTGASVDEIEEIVWDVWQMAVERESELRNATDSWLVLGDCVRSRCAEEVRRWRRTSALARSGELL